MQIKCVNEPISKESQFSDEVTDVTRVEAESVDVLIVVSTVETEDEPITTT